MVSPVNMHCAAENNVGSVVWSEALSHYSMPGRCGWPCTGDERFGEVPVRNLARPY